MRVSAFELWGSSDGLARLAPPTRVFLGVCLTSGLLLMSPGSLSSALWVTSTLVIWLLMLRPPIGMVLVIAVWTVFLGSPIFLLAGLLGAFTNSRIDISSFAMYAGSLSALKIVFKGSVVTTVALTTLSTLNPAQLQEGLVRLYVPRTLAGLLTQILIQTGLLLEETVSLVRALRLRVPSSSLRIAWLLARGIPTMWLPRILDRAERVAAAMTLRGFDGRLYLAEPKPLAPGDWAAAAGVLVWLSVSLAFIDGSVQ